jgi:hypothetical protein
MDNKWNKQVKTTEGTSKRTHNKNLKTKTINQKTEKQTYKKLTNGIKMTEPTKMINRRIAFIFAILCIATLVALNISIITYFSEMNAKNKEIQTLNDQMADIQAQVTNFTSPSPRLIAIGMEYKDNRTDPNAPFLQITGYVVNVGTGKANNCALHVSATKNGNNTAIDTFVPIDPVEAGTYKKIDIQVPYNGDPIITYTANLEWGS